MRGRLIVLGTLGLIPYGGVAWQVMHYLEGFRLLGFDTYYVEDTGSWPWDPVEKQASCRYAVEYVATTLALLGMHDRWSYRCAAENGRTYGVSEEKLRDLFATADILVNLTGATVLTDLHLLVPIRLYLETDPVLPQIELASGDERTAQLLGHHTHWATFGENLGTPDSSVPVPAHISYAATRQPVVSRWWDTAIPPARRTFTTITSWEQTEKDIVWQGELYTWSKHREFLKLIDLPNRTGVPLELALASEDIEVIGLLRQHGWGVASAAEVSSSAETYRHYIQSSAGEFTVAKDQNVRLRSGWFSDRSACYLASARPVVTQDTGFGRSLPVGEGLLAFQTLEEAVVALEELRRRPKQHSDAARDIAREYFEATRVLAHLLEAIGQ